MHSAEVLVSSELMHGRPPGSTRLFGLLSGSQSPSCLLAVDSRTPSRRYLGRFDKGIS